MPLRPEVIFKEFNHPVSVLMGANLANEVALGQSRALSASMQSELSSRALRSGVLELRCDARRLHR